MKTGLALSTAAAALSLGHANAYDSKMTAMSVVQQDNHLISAGTLNVTTGKFVPNYDATIALPNSPHCHWAPLQGTEGVGTATFHVNRSMFFLAKQICGSAVKPVVNQTVLVASRIPLAQDGETFIYNNTEVGDDAPHPPTPLDKMDPLEAEAAGNATIWHSFPGSEYNYPLDSWNLVWDHVCNFIVVTPRAENSETVFETWMISEFDAQARQQKDLTRQPARPKGWAKVNGLGALDFYNQAVGGPWTLNCGDNCSFFELEATAEDPSVTRIVGRNFHTGEVLSNISNTLGVSSLVSPSDFWSQEYSDFIMIGLGHCCTELGCDTSPVCKDSPGMTSKYFHPLFHFTILRVTDCTVLYRLRGTCWIWRSRQ